MKLAKRLATVLIAIVMAFSLIACSSGSDENTVKVYHMDGTFNSEEINMWRDLYIVDEDTYILTIQALNSDGSGQYTVDYVEKGSYKTNDDGTITLKDGVSGGYVMDDDTKRDWSGAGMDLILNVNGIRTFSLNDDGTWSPVE